LNSIKLQGGKLRRSLISASAGLLVLVLSGCGASGGSQDQQTEDQSGETIDVAGKIQTAPYVGIYGEEGYACNGVQVTLKFNGQQVKLKDAAGEIVGVTNLEGWKGDPSVDLDPAKYGYNDGQMCSWDFSFPGVSVESNFYTLEFSDSRVTPPTITKEELINGPVIQIG
jgi:hypothetical protein